MKTKYSWWQWPANTRPGYAPWYTVAWRMLWTPVFGVGLALVVTAFFFAYGRVKATEVLERLW